MLLSWSRLRVLSRRNDHPERACPPVRRGSRPASCCARRDRAARARIRGLLTRRRGRALAEVAGYASNCDCFAPHGARIVTRRSRPCARRCAMAGSSPPDVDMVVAHGTATRAERSHRRPGASRDLRPRRNVPGRSSAPKSMLGHAMGASGALGVAAGDVRSRQRHRPTHDQPRPRRSGVFHPGTVRVSRQARPCGRRRERFRVRRPQRRPRAAQGLKKGSVPFSEVEGGEDALVRSLSRQRPQNVVTAPLIIASSAPTRMWPSSGYDPESPTYESHSSVPTVASTPTCHSVASP
jgi:hypothetical protein